jgi:hypothetical protein
MKISKFEEAIAPYILCKTAVCSNCRQVEKELEGAGIPFDILMVDTPQGLSELRYEGIFEIEMPIIYIRDVERYMSAQTLKDKRYLGKLKEHL